MDKYFLKQFYTCLLNITFSAANQKLKVMLKNSTVSTKYYLYIASFPISDMIFENILEILHQLL